MKWLNTQGFEPCIFPGSNPGGSSNYERNYMTGTAFIIKIILDIFWYEFIWHAVKRNTVKLIIVKRLLTILLGLNVYILILLGETATFVNLYHLSLWYFVIYPDRIINELTEEQAKSSTSDKKLL